MPTVIDLGQQVKAKYPQYADMDDASVGRLVMQRYPDSYRDYMDPTPQQAAESQQMRGAGMTAQTRTNPIIGAVQNAGQAVGDFFSDPRRAALQVADVLPQAGGLAGGVAGGAGGTVLGAGVGGVPGAIGGAALGGAGGEAGRQIVHAMLGDPVASTSLQAAQGIGKEGAIQGAFEAGGIGTGKILAGVAKPVMALAVGLGKRGLPELAQTAIDHGIAMTPKGLGKLMSKIDVTGQEIRLLARRAGQAGARLHPIQLVSKVPNMIQDAMDSVGTALPKETAAELSNSMNRFLDNHIPGGWPPPRTIKTQGQFRTWVQKAMMTPEQLLNLRRAADNMASPVYAQMARNEPVDMLKQTEAKFFKNIADEARGMLNSIPASHLGDQSMAELNALESKFIRLKEAIGTSRPGMLGVAAKATPYAAGFSLGAALPGSSFGERAKHGAAMAALFSPELQSHAALAMSSPAWSALLPQLARVAQANMPRKAAGATEGPQ